MRNQRAGVEDRWRKTIRNADGTTETVPTARDGNGLRWMARWVDDTGAERSKSFARKTDALAHINEVISSQVTGSYVDPRLGKVTFDSFYKDWASRQVWESNTRRSMDLAARDAPFSHVGLADLRPSHLEAWVKSMSDRGLEPTTIRTRFANVHKVIRAAIRDRVMARDVADPVKLPRTRKAEAAMTFPSAAEVGSLIVNSDSMIGPLIALCAFAGLRFGEANGLRVSDIDFLRKEIKVQRQIQWPGTAQDMEVRPPKYGSERTVFIPDGLVQILSEWVRLERPGTDADRWLFTGTRDRSLPAHKSTIDAHWRKVRGKVGIEYRIHDLRHFFASGLIAAGCDVVTVQRALGHSSPSVTLNTYAHLWPKADDRTRNAAAALFDSALGSPADWLRTEGVANPV